MGFANAGTWAMPGSARSPGSTGGSGRGMTRGGLIVYILRRLALAVPLLLLISFGVFALVKLAPGDPVRALIGSRPANAETIAAIRDNFI